jgi:hypothetical protein
MSKLTLDDITDLRAYERGREEFRREVIALKKLRRVSIGPLLTVVFENRTTMLFQIQEMARAESMSTDEQILAELEVYNPLIPGPGELSLTLFVELRNDAELREWLPKLVGIERSLELRFGDSPGLTVRALVDPEHAAQLTREELTASVHYVRFELDDAQRQAFAAGPAVLAVDHPAYSYEQDLSPETRASLVSDWDGG